MTTIFTAVNFTNKSSVLFAEKQNGKKQTMPLYHKDT